MDKVRIYELARELKMESRKVIEDARRLGADVNVPSNTLDDAIADRIREMYDPKKELVTAPRTARLVKAAKPAESPTAPPPVTLPPVAPPPVSDHVKPRVVKLQNPAPVDVSTLDLLRCVGSTT